MREGEQRVFPLLASDSPVILSISGTWQGVTSVSGFLHVTHHSGVGTISWVGMNGHNAVSSHGATPSGDSNVSGDTVLFLTDRFTVEIHDVSTTARQLRLRIASPFSIRIRGTVKQMW
jgi:hypothetical protein